jgi:hypothetical protein
MRSVTTKHNYQPQIRPSSCAPVSRWRQGQALQVLRNLDPAGRGRAIRLAGSEGMPFLPHQGNGLGNVRLARMI